MSFIELWIVLANNLVVSLWNIFLETLIKTELLI